MKPPKGVEPPPSGKALEHMPSPRPSPLPGQREGEACVAQDLGSGVTPHRGPPSAFRPLDLPPHDDSGTLSRQKIPSPITMIQGCRCLAVAATDAPSRWRRPERFAASRTARLLTLQSARSETRDAQTREAHGGAGHSGAASHPTTAASRVAQEPSSDSSTAPPGS